MRMVFSKGRKPNNQSGFTLIDLLIFIAVGGILGAAIVMSTTQLFQGSGYSNNYNKAMNNVRNAGEWISRDGRMAETVNMAPTVGFLELTWHDYDGTLHTVIYEYTADKTITRQFDTGSPTTVAENINITPTIYYNSATRVLTLTVTAAAGTGSQQKTADGTYEITLRNE